MNLEKKSILEYGLTKSAEVLNHGFSDYLVPVEIDAAKFHGMMRADSIDVNFSNVVLCDGDVVGVGLIARRGWTSRLAALSVVPEARGKGIGEWITGQLIEESRARGDKRMVLEVIEQNERAVRLYEKLGFRVVRRLVEYEAESPEGKEGELTEIDIYHLSHLVHEYGYENLPWQVCGENLASNGLPHRAYRLGDAFAAISNPGEESIKFLSLLTLPDARNQGQAARLLQALFAMYPGKVWTFRAIFPQEMEGFFRKMGFKGSEISQLQMVMEFEGE